jgi:AcrR family transcriptional regulator
MSSAREPADLDQQQVPARRRLRSTEEVNRLILAAAEELFAARGYAGATTKEIARVAGVAEPMIFRAFGSKEKLFEAAVLEPFERFINRFSADWLAEPVSPGTPQEALEQFAGDLYVIVGEHRQLFIALATTDLLGRRAQPAFARIERVSEAIKQAHGLEWDTPVAVRAAVSMVLGMAIFEDQIYPAKARPSRERIVGELARMLIGAAGLLPARD